MTLDRRRLLTSLAAGTLAAGFAPAFGAKRRDSASSPAAVSAPLRNARGEVDWDAVRALYPLAPGWTHLASFLFVSTPKPVAESIAYFRDKLDSDPVWMELAAFTDSEGRPFVKAKTALAQYLGGAPDEIAFTSNTTTALAMAYHGLRIRPDQEILTTTHDHFVHHESIRYSIERSGASTRRIALFDRPAAASAQEIVDRIARAIGPKTRALGVTWAQSSTGVLLPIPAIAAAVERANRGRADADRCLLIVDGVHGFGNQDVDAARLGADFFAAGMHKWLAGPRGTGFLWGRRDAWPHLRPTIPNFDPDGQAAWGAWMEGTPLPPTTAAFVSPGGFIAYENLLAVPAAIELQRAIGRDRIAARIAELNGTFRREAAKLPNLTVHTPLEPALSGGITCFEVRGLGAEDVVQRFASQKIRTTSSPYKVSYPRVSAGIMNRPEDLDTALAALRRMSS